jgi:hypothetical protein
MNVHELLDRLLSKIQQYHSQGFSTLASGNAQELVATVECVVTGLILGRKDVAERFPVFVH